MDAATALSCKAAGGGRLSLPLCTTLDLIVVNPHERKLLTRGFNLSVEQDRHSLPRLSARRFRFLWIRLEDGRGGNIPLAIASGSMSGNCNRSLLCHLQASESREIWRRKRRLDEEAKRDPSFPSRLTIEARASCCHVDSARSVPVYSWPTAGVGTHTRADAFHQP